MKIVTLTVEPDAGSNPEVSVHRTEEDALAELRAILNYHNHYDDEDFPESDDGLVEYATEVAGFTLWIEEHWLN